MEEQWQGQEVLVTGAGGFIGSHLVERLAESGARVRAFVRYNSRNDYGWLDTISPSLLSEIEIFRGDLENPEAVARAVADRHVAFHLGALIPIPYSYIHPREFITTNVLGTLNLLEAARRTDVRRVVHTSTSEVYGTPQTVPISELHPVHPQSPYAASKVAADQIALSYHASFGTPVVIARPFNTFGPRQSARAIIPSVITQALARDQIEVGSLHPMRDFLYVGDAVSGMLRLGETPGIEGEIINLGTGVEISIGELVERVVVAVGRQIPHVTAPERVRPSTSELDRLLADASKAKRLLGWEPEVSFGCGLERTIEWLRGSLNAYKPEIYNV